MLRRTTLRTNLMRVCNLQEEMLKPQDLGEENTLRVWGIDLYSLGRMISWNTNVLWLLAVAGILHFDTIYTGSTSLYMKAVCTRNSDFFLLFYALIKLIQKVVCPVHDNKMCFTKTVSSDSVSIQHCQFNFDTQSFIMRSNLLFSQNTLCHCREPQNRPAEWEG